MDEHQQKAFDALQRMVDTKLHELGDRLLPRIYPALIGLETFGKNLEGKTRKGTPDSYVGADPPTCRAAVEYTAQDSRLLKKLSGDYKSIRNKCPQATTIVLCTSRSTKALDFDAIKLDASKNQVTLEIVDGHKLAKELCNDHQDLRANFLGIPIGDHTLLSFVRRMEEQIDHMTRGKVTERTLERFILRPQADRVVREATSHQRRGFFVIIAQAGMGKTTWSVEHARRYSAMEPVFWCAATDLAMDQDDPVSLAIVHAAYGTSEPQRAAELAQLLRREKRALRIIIDAVDEARNYAALARCLKKFQMSCLAAETNVLMTCREGALHLLRDELDPILPGLFEPWRQAGDAPIGSILLEPLERDQPQTLLQKEGATPVELVHILSSLPPRYRGTPLFLVQSLALSRNGEMPTTHEERPDAWVDAFSNEFVNDIRNRLQTDGRRPRKEKIFDLLGAIAKRALVNSSATVSFKELSRIPGAEDDGENTIVERAIQAGLVARRGDGVGFSHAMFLEHFAARALECEPDLDSWLGRLKGDSGREVLVKLAMLQPNPQEIVEKLQQQDSLAACQLAARLASHVTDVRLRRVVLDVPQELLANRFPSEKARGLDLLKRLPWPEAVQVGVDWYNGLTPPRQAIWRPRAAEMFLSLRVVGAFHVIVCHQGLDFEWYEPSFIRRMEGLPASFKEKLGGWVRSALQKPEYQPVRARLVKLLATLRDEWLVEHLRVRLETALLERFEHWALIHMNTHESIVLYADSVEKCWARMDEDSVGLDQRSRESLESSFDHRIMMRSANLLVFPHEMLSELIEGALASPDRRRAWFAVDWAKSLARESLIDLYYKAIRRHFKASLSRDTLIHNIMRRCSSEQAIAIYERYADDDIRADIVHCIHEVPGPMTSAFLIERLNEPQHHFSAIQSLGFIGSISAGHSIQHLLQSDAPPVRSMARRILGKLRYAPAVNALIDELNRGDWFWASDSLGRIGTSDAYRALGASFERVSDVEQKKRILRALVYRREPEGLEIVKQLLESFSEARSLIAAAIGQPDLEERINELEDLGSALKDEILLCHVIQSAWLALAAEKSEPFNASLRGVACFDLPAAQEFLEQVAARNPYPDPTRKGAFGDPDHDAKRLLAIRGHRRYQRQMVDDTLCRILERGYFTGLDIQELARWNSGVAREALLFRIENGEKLEVALDLLRYFAANEDHELYEHFERHEDEDIADIAHVYLKSPGRFAQA